MSKDSAYWKKRFTQLEAAQNAYAAEKCNKDIIPAFEKAQREVESRIEAWTARLARNNGISITEARRMLNTSDLKEFQWSVEEYIEYGRENAINGQWMKELENASARVHISQFESLSIHIQQAIEVAYGNETDVLDKLLSHIYTDSYYRTCFELQKGFHIGFRIGEINQNKLNKILSNPWAADGKIFSSRIWTAKTQMINELQQQLIRQCALGKAPNEAIRALAKHVDKKFDNAKFQAGRLVMTEEAFISSAAQKDSFQELGVEEFEIVATLDSHTSKICQAMDGKHFPMSEYAIGKTAPPFHVFCRSTTVPYFNDEWSVGERAARGEDGKTYYVPSDMTYPEWKEKFVDNTRENVIIKSAKENGINGVVNVNPKPLNLEKYSFDDAHINAQRQHNVTREEAEKFMNDAVVSLARWNGRFVNYYGAEGAVYMDTENKVIRTAFKKDEFDDKINNFMKVVLNYGR